MVSSMVSHHMDLVWLVLVHLTNTRFGLEDGPVSHENAVHLLLEEVVRVLSFQSVLHGVHSQNFDLMINFIGG
jgi:hypothetical protein